MQLATAAASAIDDVRTNAECALNKAQAPDALGWMKGADLQTLLVQERLRVQLAAKTPAENRT